MGVYRQLMRRPALPFLLIVSTLLITSPLWLDKQNVQVDKLEKLEPLKAGKLLSRLGSLQKQCGELCDLEKPVVGGEDEFMGRVKAKVNCSTLFTLEEHLIAAGGPPPALHQLPQDLVSLFTHNGRVEVVDWHMDDAKIGEGRKETEVFTQTKIEQMVENWRRGKAEDSYPGASKEVDIAAARVGVRDKRILVIGSQTPWLEVVLLARSPKEIVTLEYGKFRSEHPSWSFIRPDEFRRQYQASVLPHFDLVFSFSSVEHSGLGRYGDPLNPWGDIITIAQAWCSSTPEARLVLGVPTDVEKKDGSPGQDTIQFNAHRIYGPRLYPYLTTNWRFVWPNPGKRESPQYEGGSRWPWKPVLRWQHQPVFIFSKA